MVLNGYRCDGCNKEHLVNPNGITHSWPPALPVTWFMLTRPPVNQDDRLNAYAREGWVFCSPQCVILHMNKLV